MPREVFVALFDTQDAADAARRDLEAAGIPAADIEVRQGADTKSGSSSTTGQSQESFWEWLFGSGREDDQRYYHEHIESGRIALSVAADSVDYDRIAGILHGHDLVTSDRERVAEERTTMRPAGTAREAGAGETVLPTAKEELEVDKRQSQDVYSYRVRRYVIERPAEAQVSLHQERVEVERRAPAAGEVSERPFEESVVEVTETREEPVVKKTVQPGEAVVVRKTAEDREETVRDTVRESKVEVDKAAAADKPKRNP